VHSVTTDLLQTPRPLGGFRTILADPPWGFITYSRGHQTPHRTKGDHYVTMSEGQLKTLPVRQMAHRDCALIMWVVDSHFPQAIDLGRAWGFEFKTGKVLTWRKTTDDGSRSRMGMGYWTRKETETAFLFTRGEPQRLSAGVRELIDAPKREHSRKPEEQYDRIEALVPGPYLELFARTTRPGWTSWGNQVDRFAEAS
jgi:N6-adenosine-specific RNA methylase IME4